MSLMTRIREINLGEKLWADCLLTVNRFRRKIVKINEKSKQTQQAILHTRNNLNFNA